jgi:hypothetical protein
MGRWIKLHCQLAHHDLWLMEPFTRGQAWVDLLMLAQSKPGWIMVRGISVDLDRGQVGYSELSLSERWKWSRNKVRLFIDTLRKRQMVDVRKDNKTTVITVLNFDSYQARPTADGTANGTANDTAEGQQTDNRRTLTRIKEGKKEERKTYTQEFELFWSTYPARGGKKQGKKEAFAEWKKAIADVPAEFLISQIEALAPQYGEYPVDASRWLKHRRWEDEATAAQGKFDNQFAGVI